MASGLLITGANGYLGSACVSKLASVSKGEVVAVWHARRERLLESPPAHIHYEQIDLTRRSEVEGLFKRWDIDTVIHTAALLPDNSTDYLHRATKSNIVATSNLMVCAAARGISRFIYCSSISIYGDTPLPATGWREDQAITPSSIYGWSKYCAEECLRILSAESELSAVSLRLAGIHGPGREGGVVFHVMRAALNGEPIVLTDAANPYQLLFLGDAVDGILSAAEARLGTPYRSINLASHTYPSLSALADRIIACCDSRSPISQGRVSAATPQVMDTSRMAAELGFSPSSSDSSLQAMRNWMIAGAAIHE
jgi:UDP-glucuronate 4-epimerase